MTNNLLRELSYSTVRLEATLQDGSESVGTGFYMGFSESQGTHYTVIITNKHVVGNADICKFYMSTVDDEDKLIPEQHQLVSIDNLQDICLYHPDGEVDLVAIVISSVIEKLKNQGVNPYYCYFSTDVIPDFNTREQLSTIEDIVMLGYPNGIWDEKNNLPVARKGITAVQPNVNWKGKREFIIDIATYNGSSGSPIFIVNNGAHFSDNGIKLGDSLLLLGVLSSVYLHTAEGKIKVRQIPTSDIDIPVTSVPNNIGIAINSSRIIELENEFKNKIKVEQDKT